MIVSIQHSLWLLPFFATCVVSFQSPTKPRGLLVANTSLFARGKREDKTTDEIVAGVAPFDYPGNEGTRQKSSVLYSTVTATATAATCEIDVDATHTPGKMAEKEGDEVEDDDEQMKSEIRMSNMMMMMRPKSEKTQESSSPSSWNLAGIQSVLTTALLVTGNTVGAGALVLPELAAKPGFAISTAMFSVAYLVNLMSGLILAEVAIKQHEAEQRRQTALMGNDEERALPPPSSSFRDFANISLESPIAANGISAVSLFVNTCALTFSLGRAGVIFSDILNAAQYDVDHVLLSTIFATLLVVMGATQSRVRISQISSAFVAALFISVAGLILPGLAHVQDPMSTLLAPGTAAFEQLDATSTSGGVTAAMLKAAPIMLTTLIFQNIVPPVTRILGYDRTKSVVALVLGSFLPLVLYLSWSFVVLGDGVDTNVGVDSPLMTIFSVAAVTGSAIGCTMAVAEELESFIGNPPISDNANHDDGELKTSTTSSIQKTVESNGDEDDSGYGFQAVFVAAAVPLACSLMCHEYTDALKLSGGYGIPILYGATPVIMLWTQREKQEKELSSNAGSIQQTQDNGNIIPGGSISLGVVAAAFGLFFVNSVVGDFGQFVSPLVW